MGIYAITSITLGSVIWDCGFEPSLDMSSRIPICCSCIFQMCGSVFTSSAGVVPVSPTCHIEVQRIRTSWFGAASACVRDGNTRAGTAGPAGQTCPEHSRRERTAMRALPL